MRKDDKQDKNLATANRSRHITVLLQLNYDRVRAGKPSRYVTGHPGRLSLLPSVNEY